MSGWKQTWGGGGGRLRLRPGTSSWPFVKTSRHFWGNLISNENKYEVRSLFKVVSRSTDLWYPEERRQEGGEGGVGGWSDPPSPSPPPPHPPPSFSLLSCFLNACQESLMAVEFGQEKSGAGSFRGSGDLCLTKAAPLFVLSGPVRETERQKDWKTEEERQRAFPISSTGLLGGIDLRQTGHDHLTLHIHDHA